MEQRYERLFVVLTAVFVTFVVLTNSVGVKLFTLFGWTLPVSIIWYPLSFLVTDIVSEIYGAKRARMMVLLGFAMSLLLLGFSLLGIALPTAAVSLLLLSCAAPRSPEATPDRDAALAKARSLLAEQQVDEALIVTD